MFVVKTRGSISRACDMLTDEYFMLNIALFVLISFMNRGYFYSII